MTSRPRGLRAAFWWRMQPGYHDVLVSPDRAYRHAMVLVQVTYVVWLYFAVSTLRRAPNWAGNVAPELLWPVAWLAAVPWRAGVVAIVVLLVLGTLAAAVRPTSVGARTAAFLGILTSEALKYSYVKIDHGYHLWVLIALLLVFLPRGDRDEPGHERSCLEVVWGVQAVILATYTTAGLQKVWGAVEDLLEDGRTVLDLDSLALHVAKVQLRGTEEGVLAQLVLDHRTVGGLLMLGALVLELFAITVVFRPRAQRVFAVGFVAMHLGIGLVMDIWFEPQVLVLGVWLLASPFAVGRSSTVVTLHELPWVGPLLSSLLASRSTGERVTVQHLAEVSHAIRLEHRGASVLMVGRRAHAWVSAHRSGGVAARLRLLLPTWLLPRKAP